MSRLEVITRAERTGRMTSRAVALPPGECFITVRVPIDGWPRRQGASTREKEVLGVAIEWSADGQRWLYFAGFSTCGFPEQLNRRGDFYPDAVIRPPDPLPPEAQFVRAVVDCREKLMLKLDIDTAATHDGSLI